MTHVNEGPFVRNVASPFPVGACSLRVSSSPSNPDEGKRGDQNDERTGDQSGLLAREQLMLQGERAAQPSEPTTERTPIRMRRLSQVVKKTGLGKTSIYELDQSYGRKLALERVEGSAEPAPIISPNKCFESGQVLEGAEIIAGWRRSGDPFQCDLCCKAEDDGADRIESGQLS